MKIEAIHTHCPGHQVRFSSAAGHTKGRNAALHHSTASPLSPALPLVSLPRKSHNCCGHHSNESPKVCMVEANGLCHELLRVSVISNGVTVL